MDSGEILGSSYSSAEELRSKYRVFLLKDLRPYGHGAAGLTEASSRRPCQLNGFYCFCGSSLIWLKEAMAIRLEGDTLSNPGHRPGYGLRHKLCLEGSTLSAKALALKVLPSRQDSYSPNVRGRCPRLLKVLAYSQMAIVKLRYSAPKLVKNRKFAYYDCQKRTIHTTTTSQYSSKSTDWGTPRRWAAVRMACCCEGGMSRSPRFMR